MPRAASPTASGGVLARRAVADVLNSALGLVALMACGLIVGCSWNDGADNVLLAVALRPWLRFPTVGVGIYLGLLARNPRAVVAMQILVSPFRSLPGTFLSRQSMPAWLGAISTQWNPLSSTVGAIRQPELGRQLAGRRPRRADGGPLAARALAIFLPLSARRYRGLAD